MKKFLLFIRPVLFAAIYSMMTLVMVSCHHPNSITKTQTSAGDSSRSGDPRIQSLLLHIKENEPAFKEIAARMKTKISSPSLNQSFTTNIRWKKGEKIWLSMSIIGIEGGRVLITRDSIKIMDKLNERYILKPISYIKEKTFVDLAFSDLENILLGQLIFTDTSNGKYSEGVSTSTITADGVRFLTTLIFDKPSQNLNSMFVSDKEHSQTIESTYSNYQMQFGKLFSMDRNLKINNGPQTFEMNTKIQSIELRENQEYPFTINPGYKIE